MERMEKKIEALKENKILSSLGDELAELYATCGKPEQADGPSTDVRGTLGNWIVVNPDDIGDWQGKEKLVADEYTALHEMAIEAVGYIHIGSGIVHTQYHNSEDFSEYQDRGLELIRTWFTEHDEYVSEFVGLSL
jgi:hypothetical protein